MSTTRLPLTVIAVEAETPSEGGDALRHPAMGRAARLMSQAIIIKGQDGQLTVADICEVEAYSAVGPLFRKAFAGRTRQPGEWFVARSQGGMVYTIVVDPTETSVVRIKKVRVNGKESPLSVFLRDHHPDVVVDGAHLQESEQVLTDASVYLTPKKTGDVQLEVRQGVERVLATIFVVR